jgi:hypothetical protein
MLSRSAVPYSGNPLIRYVNCTINNPLGTANQTATFDVTYDRSILNNAGDNLCGVVSFSLPLQNLPLFIFPVTANNANPNYSTLQVGVCHNVSAANIAAGTAQVFSGNLTNLIWQTQELGLAVPVQDSTLPKSDPYYYCYSYEHFVNLVNVAVQASWVNQSNPGAPPASGFGKCPKFSYDDAKFTFRWDLPTAFASNVAHGASDGWTVCWNEPFDNLVNNFNAINDGSGHYILEDTLSALTNTVSGNILLNQDYPTTDAFNSAQRILCLTSSIPIAADYFAAPYAQNNMGGLSNTEKVLVDVSLDFDNNVGAQRSVFVYNPQIYQISDMESTLPLTRISLKFVWMDSLNERHEIPLKQSDTILVKLGFFSKKLPFI